jgi:hypothetical protein
MKSTRFIFELKAPMAKVVGAFIAFGVIIHP